MVSEPLRQALERAQGCIQGLLKCTPVRDVTETLAEIESALATRPAEQPEVREVLEQALTRMDRARNILTRGTPSEKCYWGVLDTTDLRFDLRALAARPAEQPEPLCGMSWNGHNVSGDERSIAAVRDAVHAAATLPALRDRLKAAEDALATRPLVGQRKALAYIDPEYTLGQPYGKRTSPVTTYPVHGWTPLYP